MMTGEFELPELTIFGLTEPPAVCRPGKSADPFLERLRDVSKHADGPESLINRAIDASYELVGFGPMAAALNRLTACKSGIV